jgi:hypothetical protein
MWEFYLKTYHSCWIHRACFFGVPCIPWRCLFTWPHDGARIDTCSGEVERQSNTVRRRCLNVGAWWRVCRK